MRKVLIIVMIILALGVVGVLTKIYVLPKFNKENRQIDTWLETNNLNKYGDPQNTAYSNGSPVCSTCDRYEYIKNTYSDKPWEK